MKRFLTILLTMSMFMVASASGTRDIGKPKVMDHYCEQVEVNAVSIAAPVYINDYEYTAVCTQSIECLHCASIESQANHVDMIELPNKESAERIESRLRWGEHNMRVYHSLNIESNTNYKAPFINRSYMFNHKRNC